MKITAFLIMLTCFQVNAYVSAQDISLSEKNTSLKKILAEIRKQSTLDFILKAEQSRLARPITINVQKMPVTQVLELIFKDQPLGYLLEKNTLIVKTKLVEKPEVPAPPKTITGIVTDAKGLPLIGVSVLEKGTKNGIPTGSNGEFKLTVADENSILIFSLIGFQTQELKAGQQQFKVVLQEDFGKLDEVLVVGYGVQKKSDVTGAISSIKGDDLPKVGNTSVEQMLAGKVAGMQVKSNDAQPGGGVEVLIRGSAGSTKAGNSPLYIVDGFPLTGGADPDTKTRYSIGTRSPLNSINPNDIESIEVLKDASATAIYGARAANGVILITTKTGKQGKGVVAYDGRQSFQRMLRPWDMLDGKEWMQARNNYLTEVWKVNNKIDVYGGADAANFPPPALPYSQAAIDNMGPGTDWISEVTRTGRIQEHNLSLNGANEKTSYLVSANSFDQEGVVKRNDFKRFTGRINFSQKINNWIQVGLKATGSNIQINNPALGTGDAENTGVIESALRFNPTLPVRLDDGSYSIVPNSTFFPNPVSLLEITNISEQNRLFVQTYAEFEPIKDLKIRSQVGFDRQNSTNNIYLPKTTLYGAAVGGQANVNENNRFDKLFNTVATYHKNINQLHNLDFLVGYEWQSMGTNGINLANNRFPTDAFLTNNIGAGESERPVVGSYKSVNELASYFTRINYNYKSRYMLTLTMRADGSSKFGARNRFGYFPSGAIAWRLSNESFMKNIKWISNAKLRLSAGQTGNSNISGAFAFYSFDSNYLFGNNVSKGTNLSSYANPELKWETTTEYNLGIDLGFLNNRINVTTELYSKRISDLLGYRKLKTYLPMDTVAANLGKTSSKGFEITVNTVNTTGAFKWSSDITVSAYRDRWVERSPDVVLRSFESVNDPIRVYWGYVLDGLVKPGETVPHMPGALPGTQKIKDINGFDANNKLTGNPDGIINDADVVKIGNQDPKLIFGFGNTFTYKNFDLNVHVYGMFGIMRSNDYLGNVTVMNPNIDRGWNIPNLVNEFWSSTNQDAKYPNVNVVSPFPGAQQYLLQKADFIRVRNITLGYTLTGISKINKWFSKVRLYADASNPFVITKFKGIDPEFSGIYPPARSYSMGLNLQF